MLPPSQSFEAATFVMSHRVLCQRRQTQTHTTAAEAVAEWRAKKTKGEKKKKKKSKRAAVVYVCTMKRKEQNKNKKRRTTQKERKKKKKKRGGNRENRLCFLLFCFVFSKRSRHPRSLAWTSWPRRACPSSSPPCSAMDPSCS